MHKNNSTILTKVDNVKIWHKRLGHPDKLVLKQGITHLNGFPNKLSDDSERVCVGCALGKMKSESHPLSNKQASHPLELVHMDLMEMPMLSYRKYRYILMIFDDHTSYIWGGLLRNKSDTIICFEQWYKSQKNLYPKYMIAYVRTDRGGEFMSSKFEELLKNYGIIHQRSTPHIHQQNGRVTITVQTPALCLLDTSDKSFSLCLPYSSLTLCLIRTDNPTSLLIPSLVRLPCSTYGSFLITNTVVSLVH